LVRDHAGIKPLYFGQSGRQVVFASQYDQVRQHHLFRQSTINPQVLKLYLKQHYVPAPFGLHMGIEQVRPGEIICFEPTGKRKYFQHWELPDSQEQYIVDPRLAARSVESALRESVHEQLLSDVPLGAFLSGGVDSPLICSFASENDPDFPVFTIGSDSHEHDESGRAKIFNEALGTRQNLWHLNGKEILEHWEEAMQSLHEPLADFSIFPTYLVSKLARQHVTVALSGDGGDELFFGYERFWSVAKNIEFQHWPRLLRMGIYGYDKYFSGNKKFNSLLLTGRQGSAHESLHSRFPDEWIHQIFPDLRRVHLPEKWDLYAYDNRRDIRRLLFQMRKAEFYGMMQKTLRKVDLASMENSLEVRVPFLKKGFIEMANGFDPFLSFGEGQKKKLLKNVLSSRVPKVEDDNVKRGFTVPLGSWIKKELRPVFGDMLLSDKMLNSGVDLQATERMLQEHVNDKDSHKWALFTLYALSRNL
jgi:asparagine synthase (glutamine-hydrolysing)